MIQVELLLVAAGMILLMTALFVLVRVYLLVQESVNVLWVRFCWWALGLLVVLFLCGYALILKGLYDDTYRNVFQSGADSALVQTRTGSILANSMVIALIFFWGSVFVLLSSWLFLSTLRHRIRVENELLETTKNLLQSRKTEAIGRLAGGVAHDFNNVLTVIMGYAEVAMHYSSENPDLVDSLKMIKEGAERGRGVTDQLLAFCRSQTVEFNEIAVEEILDKAMGMLNQLIPENVVLSVECSTRGWISGAVDQIELVLMNLILNARDAMPDGGQILITVTSELSSKTAGAAFPKTGRDVVITIRDNGKGMDQETSSRVFDPYFTTKSEGTGLGLSMVSWTVTQHGGEIHVQSALNDGTQFRLTLPEVQPVTESSLEDGEAEPDAKAGPTDRKTILVVDDDEQIRRLSSLALRSAGYHVLEAGNGAEALYRSEAMSTPIHLLLTDITMPNMDGPELVKLIQRVYPDIRVLFMSGYQKNLVRNKLNVPTGSHFISKPFLPSALQEMVDRIFEQ